MRHSFIDRYALLDSPLHVLEPRSKLLAFTAEAIRGRLEHSEFLAVTEREPAQGNVRDQFVSSVLADNGIRVLPLAGLRKWAHDVAPVLKAG